MELVIELVGRGSRHFDFQKVSGDRISIGRSFTNDVVLTDPHVCAEHAVIESDENGEIILHDLNSVNGTHTKDHKNIDQRHRVISGDEFVIGKTRIRIYRQNHAVQPSIRLNHIEKILNFAGKPWVAVTAVLLVMLLHAFHFYNMQLEEIKSIRLISEIFKIGLFVIAWPLCWSLYARIRKHELRFLSQLSVAMVFLFLLEVIYVVMNWLNFHVGEDSSIPMMGKFIMIAVVLILVWTNFYLSSFQSNKQRWVYSSLVTSVVVAMSYLVSSIDYGGYVHKPSYFTSIYPHSMTFYSTESNAEYIKNAEQVFDNARNAINKK